MGDRATQITAIDGICIPASCVFTWKRPVKQVTALQAKERRRKDRKERKKKLRLARPHLAIELSQK
jgi:hypothetical protein